MTVFTSCVLDNIILQCLDYIYSKKKISRQCYKSLSGCVRKGNQADAVATYLSRKFDFVYILTDSWCYCGSPLWQGSLNF